MHSAPLLALLIIASALCSSYPRRHFSASGMVAPRCGWSSRTRHAVDAMRRRPSTTTSSVCHRATAASSILAVGRDDDDVGGDRVNERGGSSGDGDVRALPMICVRRPMSSPTRCSSRRAASIVRDSTRDDGLLIITCDASGRGVSFGHSFTFSKTEKMINLDYFTRHHILLVLYSTSILLIHFAEGI